MNEEEMKNLWLGQRMDVTLASGLLQELHKKGNELKKGIKKRDRLEALAALLVSVFFLGPLFSHDDPFVKIGCVLIILYAIEVVVVLRLYRKEPQTEGLPLKEQLQKELLFFLKQKALLKNVAYWYIAPCFIGLTFFAYGVNHYWWAFLIHTGINMAVMVYIYRLNRKSVREQFSPVIDRLQALLKELEK